MTKTWKLKKGVTWRDKLLKDHPSHGKIVSIPERMQKSLGTGKMMIPRPLDVDAMMQKPRKGQLITTSQVRALIAKAAGVDAVCPLTTGIFARIAAEAAEEDRAAGKKRITPYWRLIKDDGKLNPKNPGGVEAQAKRLMAEGFEILPARGKQPPKIKDFEAKLIRL